MVCHIGSSAEGWNLIHTVIMFLYKIPASLALCSLMSSGRGKVKLEKINRANKAFTESIKALRKLSEMFSLFILSWSFNVVEDVPFGDVL